jgi:hypothetical protein
MAGSSGYAGEEQGRTNLASAVKQRRGWSSYARAPASPMGMPWDIRVRHRVD